MKLVEELGRSVQRNADNLGIGKDFLYYGEKDNIRKMKGHLQVVAERL